MSVLFIILIIVGVSAQSVFKKAYNTKNDGGVFLFNAVTAVSACLFFVLTSGFDITFDTEILPYAAVFSIAYILASAASFLAIMCGSLSLTSLATSFSLLIPTFYGLIFDGEEFGLWLIIGLVLLAVSLVLINLGKGETRVTLKWAVYAIVALVANGICSTVQPIQTVKFNGKYNDIFMIISLAVVAAAFIVISLVSEKKLIIPSLKSGAHLMIACGLTNGAVNLFVMLASVTVNKSVMFPLISAGGIVLTWLISVFMYKEKLDARQNLGLIFGVASIVFLNL